MDEVTSSKDSSQNTKKRGKFSGRIGYVLAVAGSAVGLGNIWRFPYLAAKYGGGIFLLIYLILVVTFGYVPVSYTHLEMAEAFLRLDEAAIIRCLLGCEGLKKRLGKKLNALADAA